MFSLGQFQNPVKLVFDHHTITNKPHNIQIRPKNRTKPVGHYTAPRRKITSVGGNLPLVAQFRVLCRSGLLTAQHSFLFLFLFPLFLPFPLLFSSFLSPFLSSLPPFLSSLTLLISSSFSFPPFLFSLLLHGLVWSSPLLLPTAHVSSLYRHGKSHACVTHGKPCVCGMPCVTHMACHVSHMHAFAMHCDTWLAMCHHMVGHVSSTWLVMCRPTRVSSKYVKFRLSQNSTKFDWVANFHETIPTVQSVLSSEI